MCIDLSYNICVFTNISTNCVYTWRQRALEDRIVKSSFKLEKIKYIHAYSIVWSSFLEMSISHLICTLISENKGLEKLRSASSLRKISVPAHLIFFSVCHLSFFLNLYHRSEKKFRWQTEKKIRCAGTEIFLRFEADLDFSRPSFSEIKVQIKWLSEICWGCRSNNSSESKNCASTSTILH